MHNTEHDIVHSLERECERLKTNLEAKDLFVFPVGSLRREDLLLVSLSVAEHAESDAVVTMEIRFGAYPWKDLPSYKQDLFGLPAESKVSDTACVVIDVGFDTDAWSSGCADLPEDLSLLVWRGEVDPHARQAISDLLRREDVDFALRGCIEEVRAHLSSAFIVFVRDQPGRDLD